MTQISERTGRESEAQTEARGGILASKSRVTVLQGCLGLVLVMFIALAALASTHARFALDLDITLAVQTIRAPWFDLLMRIVSWPGYLPQAPVITIVLVLIVWWLGTEKAAFMTILTAIGVQLLNWLIKILIQRPRPGEDLVEVYRELSTFSFPSGHVMFYTAFYGFLLYLSYRLLKNYWLRLILGLVFGGLILLVGVSRIYLGVHWPSDVLGAYIIGALSLLAAIQFYRWGRKRFFTGE